MNTIKLFILCSLTLYNTTQTMDDTRPKQRTLNVIENALIGAISGTIPMITNQPLIYFKNTHQRGNYINWSHPKVWYRGLGVNISAIGPTTALQIVTNEALESVIPGKDASTMLLRAFIAGVASATLCAPLELVILEQQKKTGNVPQTIRRLTQEAGLKVVARGWSATALREGPWSVAYLAGFPIIQEMIKNQIDDPTAAMVGSYVGAGAITGGAVAIVTHPIDTIKTCIQNDYQGTVIRNMRDAGRSIYKTKGLYGFFSGGVPRTVHCALTVAMISTLNMYLSQKMAERE